MKTLAVNSNAIIRSLRVGLVSQTIPKIRHGKNLRNKKYKAKNKSSDQRISLNRSQYKSCSTGYNPLTSNQVVYK